MNEFNFSKIFQNIFWETPISKGYQKLRLIKKRNDCKKQYKKIENEKIKKIKLNSNQLTHKISFCTACKGRKWQLEKTLKKNLNESKKFKNNEIEFVLIDYNSEDGLENWIKKNFAKELKSKKLIYYKNKTFKEFNMAHSKNCSHTRATGKILCNLDADNFITTEFVEWLSKAFQWNKNIIVTSNATNGSNGRIAITKENFLKLRGYDESFGKYSLEEIDFINRAKKAKLLEIVIPKDEYIKYIENNLTAEEKNSRKENYFKNKKFLEKRHNKTRIINPNGFGKGNFKKN